MDLARQVIYSKPGITPHVIAADERLKWKIVLRAAKSGAEEVDMIF
jgi:hypothetical protein